jgi:hypothetical protein
VSKYRQWEIWKHPAMGRDHWYVLLSGQERLDSRHEQINGLICFTLRGPLSKTDVALNSADGFQVPTACQCDLIYPADKSRLYDRLGRVSDFRQDAIKRKLIEVLRLTPNF